MVSVFQDRVVLCEDGYELYVQDSCVGKIVCDVNKVSLERVKQKAEIMFEWLGESGYEQYEEWYMDS